MTNIKKYVAAFAIALMTGFGVFSVVTAINAQTKPSQEKQNVQKEQNESQDEMNEAEENEADENESEESEENEANEQAEQAKLAQEASITREQAEMTALGKTPGKIVEGELEKEDGKLIYSFDIKTAENTIIDVEVDANTGEILKAQPDDNDDGETGSQ